MTPGTPIVPQPDTRSNEGGASAEFTALEARRATISYVCAGDPWYRRVLMATLEQALGRRRIERDYRAIKASVTDSTRFFEQALSHAGINVHFDGYPLDAIQRTGPLLLIANHPFGIIDGLILCRTALSLRNDFRILLHSRLCQDPDLDRFFLPVDFSGDRHAIHINIRTKRAALDALRNDKAVAIFPGGGVATSWSRLGFGATEEFPWSTFPAKLVRESGATVLPVYFHGRNSRLFQLASHIGEPLRLSLLIHEALNKFSSTVQVTVGTPLQADLPDLQGSRQQVTDFLKTRVLDLVHE